MIDLSIVSGTFDRLAHLQKMIESVRGSIGVGISYEIVLVDGGSTDGTIEWCKEQPDIVLIEQGELLGAIKAFNAGLYAARGRYCVVGNDDIIYWDESLPLALAFMEDHPDVGVGCLYQDRDHPGLFDLSRMPAVMDGAQVQHIYGQVCIVPKWLGDDVGWWGDFPDMRTYGGDNNLSCYVLERGYRVTGIPCACVSDMKVDDELRRINNEDQIVKMGHRRGHPDSNAWGKHWTHRDGTCGPIITSTPYRETPLKRKTRFLYLPIYELGHPIQKSQKRGLREALSRYGMVYEYDYHQTAQDKGSLYMANYLLDLIDAWRPDILLTQIHSPDDKFNAQRVFEIRKEAPNLTWVNWNGDYHPEDLLSDENIEMCSRFDLQCVVTTQVREEYARRGVPWMYWQIGYEESDAEPDDKTSHHDVVFLANGYSGNRIRLGKLLRRMKDVNVGIYGSWSAIPINGANLYNFDEGRKLYRAAKLSIGDDQWKAPGFVSNRLFQALAAGGAMLLHQRVPELDTLLGLKDGVHYVAWDSYQDLQEIIYYYLNHEDERVEIATAGNELILKEHSFDHRVRELMNVL